MPVVISQVLAGVDLSLFRDRVVLATPTAPQPLVDRALISAAGDFCRRALVLQRSYLLDGFAGGVAYDLPEMPGEQLVCVLKALWNERVLRPAAAASVRRSQALRDSVNAARSTPVEYFQRTPLESTVYVYPAPAVSEAGALYVTAAYQPDPTATSLAQELFYDHLDDIAAGAISNLAALPGQLFSSSEAVRYYGAKYEQAVQDAKRQSRVGRVMASQRVQGRAFA